jgi:hypothetical protein
MNVVLQGADGVAIEADRVLSEVRWISVAETKIEYLRDFRYDKSGVESNLRRADNFQ